MLRSAFLSLAIVASAPVAAAVPAGLVGLPPETHDVRREYLETAVGPLSAIERFSDLRTPSFEAGRDVIVGAEEAAEYRYLFFVPEIDGEFPLFSAGTYILRRRRNDGGLDQLKIFLRSDPGFFVRIWPDGEERSTLSLYLAGVELYRGVPLPVSLEVLLEEPFERIVDLTQGRIDWPIVFPETAHPGYRDVAVTADRARSMLHTLPDAEDGAMDEEGNLVFIDSLVLQDQEPGFNCSGFAKWIVDGLFMGRYGRYLPIEPLKRKHLELRGHRWSEPLEEDRDPYFGLDWTRNLATAMLSAEQGGREVHPEAADVRTVPYHVYVEDIGFPVERLPQILYFLAVREPGHVYIASLNRAFGSDPPLNQHVHVAVFFPYFDEKGRFFVDVMERNVETSLESLDRRYHADHVHLVSVRADRSFAPPVIRN